MFLVEARFVSHALADSYWGPGCYLASKPEKAPGTRVCVFPWCVIIPALRLLLPSPHQESRLLDAEPRPQRICDLKRRSPSLYCLHRITTREICAPLNRSLRNCWKSETQQLQSKRPRPSKRPAFSSGQPSVYHLTIREKNDMIIFEENHFDDNTQRTWGKISHFAQIPQTFI